MSLLDMFLLIALSVGVFASAGFAITYAWQGSLRSKVAQQILGLNITIAFILSLSIAHGLSIMPRNVIFLLQGILLLIANVALLYQFVILKQARNFRRKQVRDSGAHHSNRHTS